MAQVVRRIKGEPVESPPATVLDLGFVSFIPRNYIPSDRGRMEVYRKIALAGRSEDLEQLCQELKDVHGPVPQEVKIILEMAEIRIAAAGKGIKSIAAVGTDLIFAFDRDAPEVIDCLSAVRKGKISIAGPRTVRMKLEKNYFEPGTLLTILRRILKIAA